MAGKIINNNYPEKMNVDIYYKYGQNCGKKGRKMTLYFSNITLISNFIFDSISSNVVINHYADFDKFIIESKKYKVKELNLVKVMGGIKFVFPKICSIIPDGESEIEIIESKIINTTEIFNI